MEPEAETLNLDGRDITLINIDSAVASVRPVGETCVACNATPTPESHDGILKNSDIADFTEDELDQCISAKADAIARHHRESDSHAEAESVCWREMMPLLDEKQVFLTKRGKKSGKNFTAFLRLNHLNPSTVRSWRRRLKREEAVAPEPEPLEPCEEASDAPDNEVSRERQDERVEIETGAELIGRFAKEMLEVLIGKSIRSDSMRIKKAAEMVGDLQRTLDEGKLFDSAPRIDTHVTVAPAIAADNSCVIGYAAPPLTDWEDVLSHSVAKLEQRGDTLPVAVSSDIQSARKRLDSGTSNEVQDCISISGTVPVTEPTPETALVEPQAIAPEAPAPVAVTACSPILDAGDSEPIADAPAQVTDQDPIPVDARLTWTPLSKEKRYDVRPVPTGGFGIFEIGSTVLRQWHETMDMARDAITALTGFPPSALKHMENLWEDIA